MSTKVLLALGVIWGICLSVVALPCWSAPRIQTEILSNDSHNTSFSPAEVKYSNAYPGGYLSPKRALELALQHNPRLTTFSSAVEERSHLLRQAGRLPNPELEFEVENFGGSGEFSGSANAETTVRLQQRLELGGKRQRRMDVARSGIKMEEKQHRVYLTDLHAQVRTRAVELAVAQEQLELTRAQTKLSRTLLEMVRERIDAGKAANIEQIAFKMQLSEAKLELQEAQTEAKRAKYALAALWGEPSPSFAGIALELEPLPAQRTLEQLYTSLSDTPATVLARTRTERALQEVHLEQARRIPDLNLSMGAKEERDTSDHALIAGIGLEIPLFDRNQDAVAAARARQRSAEAALHASVVEQSNQLQDIWHALAKARQKVKMLRTEILPAAQEHFEAVTYAYRAGKYTYQRVLDAQQNLFNLRRRHLDILGDIHRRDIELERICGKPDPWSVLTTSEPTPELTSVMDTGDKQ